MDISAHERSPDQSLESSLNGSFTSSDENNASGDVPRRLEPFHAIITRHGLRLSRASLQFIFRDNNLPLFINLVYHAWTAHSIMTKPSPRYPRRWLSSYARAWRTAGITHLAFALLAALTLKKMYQRRRQTGSPVKDEEQFIGLTVLSLASIGPTWAGLVEKYQFGIDALVLLVNSIALTKTVRRTGLWYLL
ncbi:hypothetical protein EC973_009533 [Apophysomyces ossiformis]|uniref:Uncharacterized protein n=1 Tax=Apophysomyces ossiformis TaxID=679940 RepID=A0A8H7BLU2_9FUNG|nr:hypothetical protein EC973_009533 [Apophysomyces ossiformis]